MRLVTLPPRLRRRKRVLNDLPDTDETLLIRYRDTGNRELFSCLVRRYERELFVYLRRYLGDADLAEDTFQATFLQVHLKCAQFEAERRFRPWLYTIATHQAIDAQRKNRRHKAASLDRTGSNDDGDDAGKIADLLECSTPNPLQAVSEAERQAWMRQALSELPEAYRTILELVYYQELMYREAAEVLNIPVGTAKSRVHAAIARLNQMWHAAYQDPL